ncbi:MAG: hypothetical protein AB7R90_01260 [Reyranellaceae bacterium]
MSQRKRFDPAASPRHRQQRVKNWAMLIFLLGLVALFFVLSIVRMGGAGGPS